MTNDKKLSLLHAQLSAAIDAGDEVSVLQINRQIEEVFALDREEVVRYMLRNRVVLSEHLFQTLGREGDS